MTQQSILITGCSTGIGRHCALRLHEMGWQVFATARRLEDLEDLRRKGLTAIYLDYTEPQSISACVEVVLNHTRGKLDALFNNGAYAQPGAVEDLTTDMLREQFEANFFGWHELTRQIVPIMRAQGHGRIVHCSSVLGFVPLAFRGSYVSSKFALEGLADTMRLELHGSNISLVLIEPGAITSNFRENARKRFVDNINIDRSVFKHRYKNRLSKLESDQPDRFELTPEAVLQKLLKALTATNPKPRYRVTIPTHIVAYLKRFLPERSLDAILRRNGD
ncbi:Short-chain dehydrogenase [Cohaesibacter sp. ES.047]|uniref:SDR family oxidoreductase n=1 Tax=Cohaesibacter sp. ES.047 TaxID=1798205 RepID=UPI000BB8DBFD|nr:SDR family oxidoreductase [Cohaesibacter sp. ES.047]SNY90821.1 Short-chain dehydrogenase [Cohaesibacter sp. ES.047]